MLNEELTRIRFVESKFNALFKKLFQKVERGKPCDGVQQKRRSEYVNSKSISSYVPPRLVDKAFFEGLFSVANYFQKSTIFVLRQRKKKANFS